MTDGSLISLRGIQLINLACIAALSGGATLLHSAAMGLSVAVGGGLATVSFLWLKKDITGIFGGSLGAAKVLFFIKYYARLALLAAVLYIIVRQQMVNVIGLLAGLSSIVLSIVVSGAAAMRKANFTMKEAA
ncbi:MAG: ATP synthase subunit I [Thermodesulfobacteriota bacterium]